MSKFEMMYYDYKKKVASLVTEIIKGRVPEKDFTKDDYCKSNGKKIKLEGISAQVFQKYRLVGGSKLKGMDGNLTYVLKLKEGKEYEIVGYINYGKRGPNGIFLHLPTVKRAKLLKRWKEEGRYRYMDMKF
tara:strand:+ start:729 stop:1121 length:393 start_codon:yes stop_codon:yes gene_type:complete